MQGFTIVSAEAIDPARLHAAFAEAFSDYLLGPFQLPLERWPQFLGRQGVEPERSRVALQGDAVLAFALVAPRPALGSWRLATMGAVPAARGSGAAPALLDDFIARAGQAGMRRGELECFEQNTRALQMYRGRGFQALHPLYGYTRPARPVQASPAEGESVALEEAWLWLDAASADRGDLPLQVTPPSLRALPEQLQAWRLGAAQVVFSEGPQQRLTLHSLVDLQPLQHDAQLLVASLLRRYPGWSAGMAQLQRPDLGGEALERLGFERLALNQLWLRRQV